MEIHFDDPSRPSTSRTRRKPASPLTNPLGVSWMVTFGDLMTLLFCFFLALISTGSFDLGGASANHHSDGPVLAHSSPRMSTPSINRHDGPELYLTEKDLTNPHRLRERVNAMIPPNSDTVSISIRSCPGGISSERISYLQQIALATTPSPYSRIFTSSETPCAPFEGSHPIAIIQLTEIASDRTAHSNQRGSQ